MCLNGLFTPKIICNLTGFRLALDWKNAVGLHWLCMIPFIPVASIRRQSSGCPIGRSGANYFWYERTNRKALTSCSPFTGLFQAKVNGFTSDKMKDSQTLINAEQIELDAMEVTIDPASKAKRRNQIYKRNVYTLPYMISHLCNVM